jgi:hypothetical protein
VTCMMLGIPISTHSMINWFPSLKTRSSRGGFFKKLTPILTMSVIASAQPPELRITVHVTEENGAPIAGAQSTFVFINTSVPGGDIQRVNCVTNIDGYFVLDHSSLTGRLGTTGELIHKDGYYKSGVSAGPFFTAAEGKWQPWDQTYTTVLRKIGHQVPLLVKRWASMNPSASSSSGYDLLVGDWVAPNGRGKVSDIEIQVNSVRDGGSNDNEISETVAFSKPDDGFADATPPAEFANSTFKDIREAPEIGYERSHIAHHLWSLAGKDTKSADTAKDHANLFFRIRSVRNDGKIVSALYGRIKGGISVGVDKGQPSIGFTYYLNPTPNDRNLEYSGQNLFPELRVDGTVKTK